MIATAWVIVLESSTLGYLLQGKPTLLVAMLKEEEEEEAVVFYSSAGAQTEALGIEVVIDSECRSECHRTCSPQGADNIRNPTGLTTLEYASFLSY